MNSLLGLIIQIINLYQLLLIITDHYGSLLIVTYHYRSLLISTNHYRSGQGPLRKSRKASKSILPVRLAM